MRSIRNAALAAALALGALAGPAMAAPIGPDAGLREGDDGIVGVQYGYGYGPRHGWGGHHRRHHGWGHGHRHWGHHHGPRWGHRHHHHHHRGDWGRGHRHDRW